VFLTVFLGVDDDSARRHARRGISDFAIGLAEARRRGRVSGHTNRTAACCWTRRRSVTVGRLVIFVLVIGAVVGRLDIQTTAKLTPDIGFRRPVRITAINTHDALAVVRPLPMGGTMAGIGCSG
jgi:hypothetical protein